MKHLTKYTCAILLFIGANSHAQSFLTNGLVAYYQFNGNGNDASGNGNNLTVVGNPAFVPGVLGLPNSAISFNGSNYCETSALLISANPFTWSCWVNIPTTTNDTGITANTGVTFMEQTAHGMESPTFGCSLNTNTSPATVQYTLYTYDYTARTVSSPYMNLNLNQWVHVVGTSDTNGVKSIYVNGRLEGVSQPQAFGQVLSVFDIGASLGILPNPFYETYQIADIRVYDRALSSNEVSQLYAIESGQTLSIIKAVTLQDYSLIVGSNYQLQASCDLINWTNQGPAFTATSPFWEATNYWNVANWNQLFFRLVQQ